MSLKSQLLLWSSQVGDVLFGSAQAGAIGTSMGNGAASFAANAQNGSAINTLQMGEAGTLDVQISSAGIQPAGTAADDVLAVFSIPAGAFDAFARGINIQASGSVANNVNTKTLKIIANPTTAVVGQAVVGGTTVASLLTNTSAGSGGWSLLANIFKYGAAGSNTQMAIHQAGQAGNVVGTLLAPSLLTMNESAPVVIAVTGNAATAASDITFNMLEIAGQN